MKRRGIACLLWGASATVLVACGGKKESSASSEQGTASGSKLAPADLAALREFVAKTYPGTGYTNPSKLGPQERSCSLSVNEAGVVTGTAKEEAGNKVVFSAELNLAFSRDGSGWKCNETTSWFKWSLDGGAQGEARGRDVCSVLRYCVGQGAPTDLRSAFENEMKQRVGNTGNLDAKDGVYIACDTIENYDVDVTETPGRYMASLAASTVYLDRTKPDQMDESKLEIKFIGDGKTWACDDNLSAARPLRVGDDRQRTFKPCAAFEERCVSRPTPTSPPASIDAGVAPDAAPASVPAGDAPETVKQVGSLAVTLKKSSFTGKRITVEFLVKNESDTAETISGLAQFDAVNDEGDQGKLAPDSWDKCSGGVPARGVRKCKLVYDFAKPQTNLQIEVKSTGAAPSVFFKLTK